jgi:hypothetical protein
MIYTCNKKYNLFEYVLYNHLKNLKYFQNFKEIHENFMAYKWYIPSFTKNMNFGCYLNKSKKIECNWKA